jgi:DNA-binding transcriptional ArsR family regulator
VDLTRPLAVITPTLDGNVLALLAAGEVKLSGREISQRTGSSQEGVRQVLSRLVKQGIVLRERAGRTHLHALNREHLAAPPIIRLATLRLLFIERLRDEIAAWSVPPAAVALFGSIARGEATADSDIDILVVRSRFTSADDPVWRRQLSHLATNATAMTGNDCRLAEFARTEAHAGHALIASARDEGIDLFGSLNLLQPRRRRRRRLLKRDR